MTTSNETVPTGMNKRKKMRKISLRFNPELFEVIEGAAKFSDKGVSEMVRELCSEAILIRLKHI